MNNRVQELAKQCRESHLSNTGEWYSEFDEQKFAELIVKECIEKCEAVASDADFMTKSKFVTDNGRMLHEGMWGGAMNCVSEIQNHFGVEE